MNLAKSHFVIGCVRTIEIIAEKMGYIISNLKEIPLDIGYSFGKGFKAGIEKSRQNSYRYKDRKKQ